MSDEDEPWEVDFWRKFTNEQSERLNFDYSVPLPPKGFPKLGFGSTRGRFLKGFTRFEAANWSEPHPNLGPTTYRPKRPDKHSPAFVYTKRKKRRKKAEHRGALGPWSYETRRWPGVKGPPKPAWVPFNSAKPRILHDPPNSSPGVYLYNPREPAKEKIPFEESFGGKRSLKPLTNIRCNPIMNDICELCRERPEGDYFHDGGSGTLCAKCFNSQQQATKEFRVIDKSKLERYKPARYCSFMHIHEGPTAVMHLMKRKDVYKMLVRESYFANFPRAVVFGHPVPSCQLGESGGEGGEVEGGGEAPWVTFDPWAVMGGRPGAGAPPSTLAPSVEPERNWAVRLQDIPEDDETESPKPSDKLKQNKKNLRL